MSPGMGALAIAGERTPRVTPISVRHASPPCPLFDTHIVVDWSARSRPSPVRPGKDAIWWALARTDGGEAREPEYARTRHEAIRRLARLMADELDAGRRVLVGFDFPFGYPAGVAGRLTGRSSGSRSLGLVGRARRGSGGQLQQPLRGRDGDERPLSRSRTVLGAAAVMVASNDSTQGIGAHPARCPPCGATNRRPSCHGGQDRVAARLCGLRRLPDAAGACRRSSDSWRTRRCGGAVPSGLSTPDWTYPTRRR